MDVTAWALYLLIGAGAVGLSLLHYRRREPAGRGRRLLGVIRGLAVAALVLLLFDPMVPGRPSGAGTVVALVDGSLSMAMPAAGATPWAAAWEAVAALDPDRVAMFGGPSPAEGSPDTGAPDGLDSRLGPALRAAVESGAGRVVVLTDGAVDDPAEVRRFVAAAPAVDVRPVGGRRAFNAGIVEVAAPGWARAGEAVRVRVGVGSDGDGGPDSVDVALRRGDRELARARVETPSPGRVSGTELSFTADGAMAGLTRLDVVLAAGVGGSVPDDDRRSVYVRVAEEPGGVVLVSLLPDQEPRFLMPVLERALGLPVRGWMAVGDRWVRLGAGVDAGRPDAADAPRQALEDADVVVLYGLDGEAPTWVAEAADRAQRILVFPGDGARALPFEPGPARVGDWYVAAALPPSPVAPLLAGVETDAVPPLTALRTPEPPDGFWTPLSARLGRRGPDRPVVVAGRPSGRWVAVALGEGTWRWAFAGDAGRDLYDRLWSAVVGWLAEGREGAGVDAIAPVDRVVTRGEPVRWWVPGDADSVRVRLLPVGRGDPGPDGAGALDRTVAVEGGVAALADVPPGHYRYAVAGDGVGEGELTVSAFSPEFTRPAALDASAATPTAAGGARRTSARPLRTLPWGYVVVLALVSVEWVLRRRWGLR